MQFSSIVSVAALLISVISALISVFSARYARDTARAARDQADASRDEADATVKQLLLELDRRNDELAQKRKEDEAAARADVRAVMQSHPKEPRIVVKNHGPHEANELTLTYLDADDCNPAPDTREWHRLATELDPGSDSSVGAGLTVNTTRRFRVTVRWKDDTGSRSRVEQMQWD